MTPLTTHEKECAFAAIAARIEASKNRAEAREWRELLKEIEAAPLLQEK